MGGMIGRALIFLVFAGTWAQIDRGIWSTLKTYFRSVFVFIPFQIFLPRSWDVPGGIPFPGGFLIGSLLLINLFAAHAARFRFTWKRSGILLIHVGLVVLILSEVVTALFAALFIVTNILTDILYAVVDPRVRLS